MKSIKKNRNFKKMLKTQLKGGNFSLDDQELIDEVHEIKEKINPDTVLFVIDATLGQQLSVLWISLSSCIYPLRLPFPYPLQVFLHLHLLFLPASI